VAKPGALTAGQVGIRAAKTSWSARASFETLRGAAARVDEAWTSFLPRLSGIAKYTRLSGFTPPNIVFGPFNLGPGMVIPAAVIPGSQFYPVLLDNTLLEGTINVPISDYFLRIDQTYTAATRSEEAARWDLVGARTTSGANGQVAYYTWLRARGAVIVAVQAVNDQRTHLRDARNQFSVGNASKADVLRAETALASSDLALERAKNLADLSEKQVRVAIHAPDEEVVEPGEALETPLAPVEGNLRQMTFEAFSARPEIKSADANAAAARQQAAAAKSGRWPVLSAFADGIVANPNPRYFPPAQVWNSTWDVGAQLTWSPNDALTANGSVIDAESRAAATEANKNNLRDNIEVEVTQDLQAVHESDFAIESSTRELTSAEEAYRVARELFNNGRGTSTTLTDAETDLTRARLDLLNAKADARIARIRLDHALGRDAH
jgi:outer membrane protein TolC